MTADQTINTHRNARKGQAMTVVRRKSMVSAALLAIIVSGAARAEDKSAPEVPAVPAQELQAKLQYCKTCHGSNGQGYSGASPIPRLAGQQLEYIENQLVAFTEKRRENIFMFNVAHVLTPAMRAAVAKHFHDLNPGPTASAQKDLAPAGKKIFEEGVPDKDVPPCASCHGDDAKGNGVFPRLAGQSAAYIQRTLANWDKVRGKDPANPDNSAIMQPVIHGLTQQQVAAVAAYLDNLE